MPLIVLPVSCFSVTLPTRGTIVDRKLTDEEIKEIYKRIYRKTRSIIKRIEDAEDTAQEVMLKIWSAQEQLKDELKLYAWVDRTTSNTIKQFYRDRGRRPVEEPLSDDLVKNLVDPESAKRTEEIEHHLPSHPGLTGKKKMVVELRSQGYRLKEISEELDIPLGTVKTIIRSAKQLKGVAFIK